MRFSLIVATLDRPYEVEKLLQSLLCQTLKEFEIIVVDQSNNKDTLTLIEQFQKDLKIIYIHSSRKGLSYARNLGLLQATGMIIAFPDDDCFYAADVLELVNKYFSENNQIQIISTNSQASLTDSSNYHNSPSEFCELSFWNVFNTVISFTIFLKLSDRDSLQFDERFGVGAKFGSGEETDLILRLLNEGKQGHYYPGIYVFHPVNKIVNLERGYKYALGFGALHKKHFSHWAIKIHFLIYTLSSLVKLLAFKGASFNFDILKGKVIGFVSFGQDENC